MVRVKERPIIFSGPMVRAILEGTKTQTRRVMKIGGDIPLPDNEGGVYINGHEFEEPFQTKDGRFIICDNRPPDILDSWEIKCPHGVPGDRLWVRETWADCNSEMGPTLCYRADESIVGWREFCTDFAPSEGAGPCFDYDKYPGNWTMWFSDLQRGEPAHRWKPSIHMPRWASRITLEVTDVRVERVQEISPEDCEAEGIEGSTHASPINRLPYEIYKLDGEPQNGSPVEIFARLWDSINGKKPGCSWDDNPFCWALTFRRIK